MAYIVGYVYISLAIVLTLITSLIASNKIKRSGEIVFGTRIFPLTLPELAYIGITVTLFGYIMLRGFGQSYLIVLYFLLYIFIMVFLQSKLLISQYGIYYRSQYVKWINIEEISIKNSNIIVIRKKSSLFPKMKIVRANNQDEILELIKELHLSKL